MNTRLGLFRLGAAATTGLLVSCASLTGLDGQPDGGGSDGSAPPSKDAARDTKGSPHEASTMKPPDATVVHPKNGDAASPDATASHDAGAETGIREAGFPDVAPDAPVPTPCADAAPQAWTTVPAGPLPPRDQAAIFWTGTDFLVFGGTEWGSETNQELTPDGGTFSVPDGGYPLGCGIGWVDNTCSDGARFNPTTNTWTRISNVGSPPPYRWDMSWAFGGGKLFTFSGHGSGPGGWLYDVATDSWKTVSTTGIPTPRAYHASYYVNGDFFVWGGETTMLVDGAVGVPLSSGGIYSPTTDSWQPMNTVNAPPGGAYYATASSDQDLFVFGGETNPTPWISVVPTVLGAGYLYDYAQNAWKQVSSVDAPSPRQYAAAVWTGSKFVVYGGTGANTAFYENTGAMYDPATDAWTPLPTTWSGGDGGAIPSLYPHQMIWTGSLVVVWGTTTSGAVAGLLFDPVANAWVGPVTADNAPTFALNMYVGYTSTWNGHQFFEWGGETGDGGYYKVPNAAALYQPPCLP